MVSCSFGESHHLADVFGRELGPYRDRQRKQPGTEHDRPEKLGPAAHENGGTRYACTLATPSAPASESGVSAKLQALLASALEVSAGRSANLVDPARMRARGGPQVHT